MGKEKSKIIIAGAIGERTAQAIALSSITNNVEIVHIDSNVDENIVEMTKTHEFFRSLMYDHLTNAESMAKLEPVRDSNVNPKIKRNSKCPCGSNKKYKNCCLKKENYERRR